MSSRAVPCVWAPLGMCTADAISTSSSMQAKPDVTARADVDVAGRCVAPTREKSVPNSTAADGSHAASVQRRKATLQIAAEQPGSERQRLRRAMQRGVAADDQRLDMERRQQRRYRDEGGSATAGLGNRSHHSGGGLRRRVLGAERLLPVPAGPPTRPRAARRCARRAASGCRTTARSRRAARPAATRAAAARRIRQASRRSPPPAASTAPAATRSP